VLSGGGDRLDHILGWLHVLADRRWAHRSQLDAWCATTHVRVLHGEREHHWHEPERGAVVSLLPLAGPCHGVTTKGLRWPLDDATLSPTSSRGLSNAVIEHQVSVGLRSGVLAVMRPQRISADDGTLTPQPDGGTP
jgi:thiamine pyrophosphokinase